MAAFFFFSGYFARTSLQRKGRATFLYEGFIRLGLPATLYTFILGPYFGDGLANAIFFFALYFSLFLYGSDLALTSRPLKCHLRLLSEKDRHSARKNHKSGGMSSSLSSASYSSSSSDGAPPTIAKRSYFRRCLPPSATSLSSPRGSKMIQYALANGTAVPFLPLVEQFRTQDEPAFCGLSTLVTVLNTLLVDPGTTWKGVWRFFSETMVKVFFLLFVCFRPRFFVLLLSYSLLVSSYATQKLDCCRPLAEIKQKGIGLDEFACLARCNGLNAETFRRPTCDGSNSSDRSTGEDLTLSSFRELLKNTVTARKKSEGEKDASIEKEHVANWCGRCEDASLRLQCIAVANYDRKGLGQTGSGHFSPIAAYFEPDDAFLIMDVARFK